MAPNRVLAIVMLSRFDFSGLRMGRINSITLSKILAVSEVESVLRVVIPSKLAHIK
jgi:hypothetical protein